MQGVYLSVREVIQQQSLQIKYQPIINHHKKFVMGYEALSRPEHKNVSIAPDVWFAAALECKLFLEADLTAIRCAIRSFSSDAKVHSGPFLFVNVLPDSLVDKQFAVRIERILQETHFDPSRIVLEIVESTFYDVSTVVSAASTIKSLGLHIALDDMGVGGSGLRSLVDLEPDFVKIDKTLIQGIARSRNKRKMLSLVSEYADTHLVIAEGIENVQDLLAVQESGVVLSQGYYWSKPMMASEIPLYKPCVPSNTTPVVSPAQGGTTALNISIEKMMKWVRGKGKRGTMDSPSSPPSDIERQQSDTAIAVATDIARPLDGFASIVNGEIIITDPKDLGSYPVMDVPKNDGIIVAVNGRTVLGETVITSSDVIAVRFENKNPSVTYKTSVSEDKLTVTVEVQITPGTKFHISDSEPTSKLLLHVEQDDVYPEYDPSSVQEIVDLLKEQGFGGKMDFEAIQELCHATTSCAKIVLVGSAPVPGQPGYYKTVTIPTEFDQYTGRVHLSTVLTGACIAVYEPEIKGVPGKDVYNNEIPVSSAWLKPVLGDGVIEVNGHIVATRPGRVVFTKRIIDVVPELVIEHDVTVEDGKVTFDGNIIVRGNVDDGSYIRGSGTVTVCGNVFQSTIIGEKGVYVSGNIVNSSLWGGFSKIMYSDLIEVFKNLLSKLNQFYKEYGMVVDQAVKRVDGMLLLPRIAAILFEHRHQQLGQLLQSLANDCSPDLMAIDAHYEEVVNLIRTKWYGVQRTGVTKEHIEHLIRLVDSYVYRIEGGLTVEPAAVRVNSVTSGSIRATGNTTIASGTYSASIESGGSVTIQGSARGGFVVAEKTVRIRELGSTGGSETSVRVNSTDGMIIVGTRHANTLLEVAGERYRNHITERNVRYGREQLAGKSVSNR